MARLLLAVGLLIAAKAVADEAPATPAARALPTAHAAQLRRILVDPKYKVVVVNVFASWCGPCRAELPDLVRLAHAGPRLRVVAIDVDRDDTDEVRTFLASLPVELHVVRSPGGLAPLRAALRIPDDWRQSLPGEWDRSIPLTFVYRRGKFVGGTEGKLQPGALANIATLAGATYKVPPEPEVCDDDDD